MTWRTENLGEFAQKGAIPWNKGKKGYKQPKISRALKGKRISPKTEFKKGQIPWNKGKKWPKEIRDKISKANKGKSPNKTSFFRGDPRVVEENNPRWKGDDVGYGALHHWVKRKLGYPDTCEFCGKGGLAGAKIHWANISGEYKREIEDWVRLCKSCHHKFDNKSEKIWITRRANQK